MNPADYELIIVGGGPAGLTAGLYAARSQLKAVLLEKGALGGQLEIKNGFLVTDNAMRTKIPGVMAAGDIRSTYGRRVVNAAGEGAVAEQSAEQFLQEHF